MPTVAEIASILREELDSLRKLGLPCVFHPYRALALARTIAGLPAAAVASRLSISRSYLAALENYSKPVIPDTLNSFSLLVESDYKDDAWRVFRNILCLLLDPVSSSPNLMSLFEYFGHLREKLSDLEPRLLVLLFEAIACLTSLFDVIYYDVTNNKLALSEEEALLALLKEYSLWPPGKIPKMVLITERSALIGFLAGVLSAERYVDVLTTKANPYGYKPFSPLVMFDRLALQSFSNPIILASLAAFLFSEMTVTLKHNVYPLDISVRFMRKHLHFSISGPLHYLACNLIKNGEINTLHYEEALKAIKLARKYSLVRRQVYTHLALPAKANNSIKT